MFYQIVHALKSRKNHDLHFRRLKYMAFIAWLVIIFGVFDLPLSKLWAMLPIYTLLGLLGYYFGKLQIKGRVFRSSHKKLTFKGDNTYMFFIIFALLLYIGCGYVIHGQWKTRFRDGLEIMVSAFVLGRYYYCKNLPDQSWIKKIS